MQMPRTTVAVEELREAKLPYVVVLTHPTTGGVTASYAMLGDIHIAEPGALIGFAGPRVIEQTIREQLPNGFQRSEYLHAHGMVDMVVHRHELRTRWGAFASCSPIAASATTSRSARSRKRAPRRTSPQKASHVPEMAWPRIMREAKTAATRLRRAAMRP